jgi:DNA-binding Lrp family transcriptional regulator
MKMIRIVSFLKTEFGKTDAILASLKSVPEIVKIVSITGEYDILIEIESETPETIADILVKYVDSIPGLVSVHSNYILASWEK